MRLTTNVKHKPKNISLYLNEFTNEYTLHTKVGRKYTIYAIFKTGFFLNSLKKSKYLVFSVDTPFDCAAFIKDKYRTSSIKILQYFRLLLSYRPLGGASVGSCPIRIEYKLPVIFFFKSLCLGVSD